LKRRYTNSEVSGIDILETISPQGMVDYAATGLSVVEDIEYEVVVDGIVRDIASVRLHSTKWVDFLHIVKARGQWRILMPRGVVSLGWIPLIDGLQAIAESCSQRHP